jgi:hypothetical protein
LLNYLFPIPTEVSVQFKVPKAAAKFPIVDTLRLSASNGAGGQNTPEFLSVLVD